MNRIKFEVHGKVQGVFFRKYTKKEADKLMLNGWVMNTSQKTVVGEAEGNSDKIKLFQIFLEKQGSPKSRIDKLESEIIEISELSFKNYNIRK